MHEDFWVLVIQKLHENLDYETASGENPWIN
ncbi:MAG: hypothetical protein BWY82_02793 [Verrucomicrobia bacterium ADurb.Bin474]|nr:MAG: hypothetical protein BWY82_02793 [Verrucomicrobia bacterium ADurb.Bin474]